VNFILVLADANTGDAVQLLLYAGLTLLALQLVFAIGIPVLRRGPGSGP
jgi:hypothetical protein